MLFCDVNPFIRFASYIKLHDYKRTEVVVQDCRIFYAVSGQTDIFIENEHYLLLPGSLFYCCSGSIYALQSDRALLIGLNFDLTQKRNTHLTPYPVLPVLDETAVPSVAAEQIQGQTFINSHLFLGAGSDYEDGLKTILDEFSTQRIYYRENSSAILKGILSQLHRHSAGKTANATDAVSKTISYIKANFDKPLSNQMLSELTGYHAYHLNRLFTRHTGLTVHQYILNLRLNRAKDLLLNSGLSLAQIAEKTGFNSNTHFSGYFKQMVGISPLEFRKRVRKI